MAELNIDLLGSKLVSQPQDHPFFLPLSFANGVVNLFYEWLMAFYNNGELSCQNCWSTPQSPKREIQLVWDAIRTQLWLLSYSVFLTWMILVCTYWISTPYWYLQFSVLLKLGSEIVLHARFSWMVIICLLEIISKAGSILLRLGGDFYNLQMWPSSERW